jgi:hypothetical protein
MKIKTTFQAFRSRTGIDGHAEKRGPKIRTVDQAFENYELRFDGASLDAKLSLTAELFVVCKDWLKKKEGKSLYKERLLRPTVFNTNLANRKAAIQAVAEECLDALAQMDPTLWARTQFDRHKVRSLATGDRMSHAKTLAAGYNLERASWLQSGKTRTIAGSGLSEEVHRLNNHKKTKLSDLNYSDYAKLDKLAQGGTVQYLKKAERLDKMMVLNDDSLLCHALRPDQPATTTEKPFPAPTRMEAEWFGFSGFDRQLWMYAMDSYGNLFISPPPTEAGVSSMLKERGFSFFNHSSFNAGREVTSAGMICIQAGMLRWIDNNSGHYKPTPDKVRQALKLLAADGADVSAAVVGIGVYNGPHGGLSNMQCFWGQDYMDKVHAAATPFLVL